MKTLVPHWEAAESINLLLRYIGEDTTREGLIETPDRVLKSYGELFSGYKQDPTTILKEFDGVGYDELVLLKDVPFCSFCEHHWLPFTGVAHIGYFPDGRIVGVSKLARLLEVYTKRLQVQERITVQVTAALDEILKPRGSVCVIEASHQCMSCRGVNKPGCTMVTSSLTGTFRDNPALRMEFFSLLNKR